MFKLQVDEADNGVWNDVKGADGAPLVFRSAAEARTRLTELFPVLVKMENFAGPKRTRVIAILEDED